MEETQSIKKRTFVGKSTILFLLHLFLRVFVILLCPVLLVFTFQRKLIMTGEWALDLNGYIFIGILVVVGGAVFFALLGLIFASFSLLIIAGSKVTLKSRFLKKESSFYILNRDNKTVFGKSKRSFLGESIKFRNKHQSAVIWEVSFSSSVWKEISIYLLGLSSKTPLEDKYI